MKLRKRRQLRKARYQPSTLSYSGPARLSAPKVTIDRGLAWFAVWTKSRCERKAELRLREAGFATYLPTEAHAQARRGAVRPFERIPVGRYLFVGLRACEPAFGAVRDIKEVQSFVSVDGMPLRVPASAIQAYANGLSRKEVVLKGGAFSRLMAVMAQADDARARERGPFWTESEAA
jgi:transcription antitermination factor NusG